MILHKHIGLGIDTTEVVADLSVRKSPLVYLELLRAKEHEADEAHILEAFGFLDHRPKRDLGGLFEWISEDSGRDRWESDGPYLLLLGERERVAVAVRQELVLGAVLAVDGPQSVYDVAVGPVVTAGNDGLSRSYGAERPGLLHETGSGGLVDRAGDPSPSLELGVGCVHDRVHVVLGRYVSLDDLDLHPADRALHVLHLSPEPHPARRTNRRGSG